MTKLTIRRPSKVASISARSSKPSGARQIKKPSGVKTSGAYALEALITACGSLAECARFLGVQRQHVQTWRYRGEIGAHTAVIFNGVEKLTDAGFTREFMRPDLTDDDWQRMERYQVVESMQAKIEHMNKYAIELKAADDVEVAQSLITYDK